MMLVCFCNGDIHDDIKNVLLLLLVASGLGLSSWCPCTVQVRPMTWFADTTSPHLPQAKLHNATHVIIHAHMSGRGQLAVIFSVGDPLQNVGKSCCFNLQLLNRFSIFTFWPRR